ncbi:hypothetical protein HDU67_008055 [Dinochytrium kinnereticum]|nr:hypothetical protein HDU67_008055 [Dinochytrium kinnereticum]
MPSLPKVVVTGASGLLGRAVVEVLKARFHVVGTAFSRATDTLEKLDLRDYAAVDAFLEHHQPLAVIHCAAERRPDVAEKDKEGARNLNVESTRRIAEAAKKCGAWFLYISTDYVFDGRNPPYEVGDVANPLNFYGQTKYDGELATMGANPDAAILRVPVLYGAAADPSESAVNLLVPIVQNSLKKAVMDDFQSRFPTNVSDVGKVIGSMIQFAVEGKPLSGVYHFSASERMTKYGMCVIFAEILGASLSHVEQQRDPPKDSLASRPVDAQLSTKRLEEAGIDVSHVGFQEWWIKYLGKDQ